MAEERILNLGKDVTLKNGEVITIRELSLAKTFKLIELLPALISLVDSDTSVSEEEFLRALFKKSETQDLAVDLLCLVTEMKKAECKTIGLTDLFKIAAAFKEVTDWEDLKKVFFQVIPKESLDQFLLRLREKAEV